MTEQQSYTTDPQAQSATRRLYKSRRDRMIDGICGGIAEYFEVDPTIVRILWVVITLAGGSGIFLYIAAMIIMPVNPNHVGVQPDHSFQAKSKFDHKRFWGILLILLGAFFLTSNLGIWGGFSWWSLSWKIMFPVIIIATGVVLVFIEIKNRKQNPQTQTTNDDTETGYMNSLKKELRRSVSDKKIFGVCGGIGKYFGIDSTIIRIIYLILVFASFGWGLLLYVILALLMPEEKPTTTL